MKAIAVHRRAGFSLVELLVAAALAAALLTVVVMIYRAFVAVDGTRSSYGTVTVGSALTTFYGTTGTTVEAYYAPSYGRAAQAEVIRSEFMDDLQKASAVYCLGRNGTNAIHPTTIPVSTTFRGDSLDTPEAFRQLLATAIPASASTFTAYRGASKATNASVFMLVPSSSATALSVFVVYDIDLTPTASPPGTYASVKRYQTGTFTDCYDVFYATHPASNGSLPTSDGTVSFNPLVVCFERAARASVVEGVSIDRFKQAAERPFYFLWWPDPTAHTLNGFASASAPAASSPTSAYVGMGGRTAFFFVVPMFPSL